MRSLFLKVFLWFWLAMALVIGAFVLVAELTRPNDAFLRNTLIDNYTSFIAQTAALTYERDGQAGLAAYLERMEQGTGVHSRLYDEQETELSGLGALPGTQELIPRVLAQAHGPVRHLGGEKPLIGFSTVTAGGRRYAYVAQPFGPPFPPPRNLWPLVPRIFAMLLTAGLLCYLLARYIVSPVLKLRTVTRQVAGGDLSARVGPLLGRRRDELADMGRDFDAMAVRVESLVTAQRRLLGDISHELRSPLARLGVALELARRRAGAEAGASLDRIGREADMINELIGQLLTLSRVENGTGELRKEEINLCSLVREIAADADFEARGRNRSVHATTCTACTASGVAGLLRSAIENVVRNAVRHTAEGTKVEIALTCEEDETEKRALITVRDHGAGVPEAALNEIFRPFYRVEEARDRQTGGTGLGLAIAARAMHLHQGTITAANASDGGLMVVMSLPVREYSI